MEWIDSIAFFCFLFLTSNPVDCFILAIIHVSYIHVYKSWKKTEYIILIFFFLYF